MHERKGSDGLSRGKYFPVILVVAELKPQCLGTLPQSSQVGTRRPPHLSKGRVAALQRRSGAPFAYWVLTYMQGWCSLACCGKVCESACCTSDWNKEDLEHRGRKSRRLRAIKGAGRAEERREHTPVRCFRNLSFILRSRGTISTRGEKSYYSNKAPTKCDPKWVGDAFENCIIHTTGEHWLAAHTTMWTLRSGQDFYQALLTTHKAPILPVCSLWIW